jgi:hypothetical protein
MGASTLVAGLVPGVERQPLKKLKTDEHALVARLERWRGEAVRSGYAIGVQPSSSGQVTAPSHGENRGSSPLGSAKIYHYKQYVTLDRFLEGEADLKLT